MNEFVIGGIIGATQTLFGHPLDTIKVRIQNNQNWRNMKINNYYRGSLYPLCGSLVFNMIVFPVYDKSIEYTKSPTLSGLVSGLFVSPFIYVFDIGKIKRQANVKLKLNDFIKTKGKFSNLLRESLANTLYFGGYFYCKNDLKLSPLVSGGLAGLLNWTITYPIDVIRTRQIAQNISIKIAIKQGKIWKGYLPCAFRAIIVNSISFYVYEYCKSF